MKVVEKTFIYRFFVNKSLKRVKKKAETGKEEEREKRRQRK
jgi:hypothetical protein